MNDYWPRTDPRTRAQREADEVTLNDLAALSTAMRGMLTDDDYCPGEDVDADANRTETTLALIDALDAYMAGLDW